jgi:hypothetical protein
MKKPQSSGTQHPSQWRADLCDAPVAADSTRLKFKDQYEAAPIELIYSKRAGKPVTAEARPRGENVVDLMDALRQSIGKASSSPAKSEEYAQRVGRSEGNVDIDPGQHGRKENCLKEARIQAAA